MGLGAVAAAAGAATPKVRAKRKQQPAPPAQGQVQATDAGAVPAKAPKSTGRVSSAAGGPAAAIEPLSDDRASQLDDTLKRVATKLGYIPESFFRLTVNQCFSAKLGRSIDGASWEGLLACEVNC